MNNKAYVIMQGCYSDKHIVKVCLDKDLAEALVEIHNKQLGINGNYYIGVHGSEDPENDEFITKLYNVYEALELIKNKCDYI